MDRGGGERAACPDRAGPETSAQGHPSHLAHGGAHAWGVNSCCGDGEWIKKTQIQLQQDPAMIQNFKVNQAKEEKYLGLKIVSGSVSDIIDANIRMKHSKVHPTMTESNQNDNR